MLGGSQGRSPDTRLGSFPIALRERPSGLWPLLSLCHSPCTRQIIYQNNQPATQTTISLIALLYGRAICRLGRLPPPRLQFPIFSFGDEELPYGSQVQSGSRQFSRSKMEGKFKERSSIQLYSAGPYRRWVISHSRPKSDFDLCVAHIKRNTRQHRIVPIICMYSYKNSHKSTTARKY